MNVVHFHRRPVRGHFSIEGLFAALRLVMHANGVNVNPAVALHPSKGFWPRVKNVLWAARHQGDVNHITGDDHYLALLLQRDRTVLTIHDCYALERLHGLKRWLMRVFWFELPIRKSAFVTVISEETKRQLTRHIRVNPEKVIVIPDPVSETFCACPKEFNTDCPRILHIGTKENKNLPRLVKALTGVRCTLHIVGNLNERQIEALQAAHIDHVISVNLTQEQMWKSYCEADLVSFVSTYEGFGLPIVEANAVGRPVVTSNISSMPEVAGDSACLVDPHDVASIRAGIERVIRDRPYREALVRAGFLNAVRFRLVDVAEQYVSIYRSIGASALAGHSRSSVAGASVR